MSIAILSVTVLTLAVVVISCKRLNRTCNLILRCIGELQANDARETSQHTAIIALLQGSYSKTRKNRRVTASREQICWMNCR